MKLLLLALSLCIFPVNATTEINEKVYDEKSMRKAYDLGWDIGYSMGEINVICSDRQYDRYPARGGQILIEPSYKRLVEKLTPSQLQEFIEDKTDLFPKCAQILPPPDEEIPLPADYFN